MKKYTSLVCLAFLSLNAFGATGLAKPKYVSTTIPLNEDHSYFASTKQTDFWKLNSFYVPQHNPKACSTASVLAVLNALNPPKAADQKNMTAEDLFKQSPALGVAVGPKGKGQALDDLKKNLGFLFMRSDAPYSLEVVRFDGKDAKAEHEKLKKILTDNEKNPDDFIIANFLQAELTGDPEGVGHISPIGAFDAEKDRVLVLDVDREWYQPYWVSSETLMKGLNAVDSSTKKSRGLLRISRGQVSKN